MRYAKRILAQRYLLALAAFVLLIMSARCGQESPIPAVVMEPVTAAPPSELKRDTALVALLLGAPGCGPEWWYRTPRLWRDTDSTRAVFAVEGGCGVEAPRPEHDPFLWDLARDVRREAEAVGARPRAVARIIWVESRADSLAVSRVGATGLMQIMPDKWLGAFPECGGDLTAVEDNLCHGVRVWTHYRDMYDGDLRRALLAYNGCRPHWTSCNWYGGILDGVLAEGQDR